MHIFCTIVQIVNCPKIFIKTIDPNLTFTFCSNRKSKFNILKHHISTTAKGKFTIFAPLYRSLIVIKYVFKINPNLTFSSSRTPSVCQYKHQSLVSCPSPLDCLEKTHANTCKLHMNLKLGIYLEHNK